MMKSNKNDASILEIAVEPKTKSDQERLMAALPKLSLADPALRYSHDPESGQVILGSADALALKPLVMRLRREHGVAANIGAAQVAYRETITETVTHSYLHNRCTGPAILRAGVTLQFEPLQRGAGFVFINAVENAAFIEYLPGVEQGLDIARQTGVLAGFPIIDFKATLIAADTHPVHSNVLAFRRATAACCREALPKGRSILLEPIMQATIAVDADAVGAVIIGLVEKRRGVIQRHLAVGERQVIQATVPLANLMDYVDGKGPADWPGFSIALAFDHYGMVPQETADDDGPYAGAMALRTGAQLA
jgi:elongation factor G